MLPAYLVFQQGICKPETVFKLTPCACTTLGDNKNSATNIRRYKNKHEKSYNESSIYLHAVRLGYIFIQQTFALGVNFKTAKQSSQKP
jgi:hypothetical protein